MSWGECRIHDALYIGLARVTHHFTFPDPDDMNDDLHEYRYEQRGNDYDMRCWHNGREFSSRGQVSHMPEWLRAILDTAKVAGAMRTIPQPPPEVILWFRTDDDHNLVEFIEMT